MKKLTGFVLVLLLCMSVALSATAITTIPFLEEECSFSLSFTKGADATARIKENGYTKTLMWVGTVEDSTLGTAYLWAENSTPFGLQLLSQKDFSSFAGDLKLSPSPYCTFATAGEITVHIEGGIPSLRKDGAALEVLDIQSKTGMTFSVPVKDQNGDPVPGAVFCLEGIISGGNDMKEYGNITSDHQGMLTFPMEVQPHLTYWLTQVSAPAGYSPMAQEMVDVRLTKDSGFAAFAEADNGHMTSTVLACLINEKQGGQPTPSNPSGSPQPGNPNPGEQGNANPQPSLGGTAQNPNPPRTGDSATPVCWLLLMLLAVAALAVLGRKAARE